MNKFFVLLKKEIRELITLQTILPIILVAFIFAFMGKLISSEAQKLSAPQLIGIIDNDHTGSSNLVGTALKAVNFKVVYYDGSTDQAISDIQSQKGAAVLAIPKGFDAGLRAGKVQAIESYTVIRNFSATGSASTQIIGSALTALNDYFSSKTIDESGTTDPVFAKNPIKTTSFVQIGDRRAAADPMALQGFVSQQITFIPIILFFIILYAAQIIATTIATEKENKTLETLLSLPISRRSIIVAKMLAAGIVAALSSLVYMFGYRFYMQGVTGSTSDSSIHTVAAQLGLVFTPTDYLVLGVSLFFAILVALAIALILGAFAEDVKSVQSLIMPLMILIMIPYILTLIVDVTAASAPIRWLVYAIPFSHAFLTAPNLFLHHYAAIGWGIAYEIVIFLVFIAIATRIFSTDRIVTMKLNFGKKKRF